MAKIQEMLGLTGGSFSIAEGIARKMIERGETQEWLNLALLQDAQGKREEARQSHKEYLKYFPDCPRAAFSDGWFALYDGDLQKGLSLLENGRRINCYGDHLFQPIRPEWDGIQDLHNRTILLYCEGGFGDEMMALRSVSWLVELGAKVIVATTPELMKLVEQTPGISAVVERSIVNHTSYDCFVRGMSVARILNRTWKDLWTGVYLFNEEHNLSIWNRIIPKEVGKLNVGLRWSGNPRYEHEQLRKFPSKLMLDLGKLQGINFYSLQKGDSQLLPDNVTDLESLLGDWQSTASAIFRLDLVITSCTAIAHLAAGMGKPTWVIVPVMPYYCWAQPGSKSSWYPTVTLFRQIKYGEWEKPFTEVRRELEKLIDEKSR